MSREMGLLQDSCQHVLDSDTARAGGELSEVTMPSGIEATPELRIFDRLPEELEDHILRLRDKAARMDAAAAYIQKVARGCIARDWGLPALVDADPPSSVLPAVNHHSIILCDERWSWSPIRWRLGLSFHENMALLQYPHQPPPNQQCRFTFPPSLGTDLLVTVPRVSDEHRRLITPNDDDSANGSVGTIEDVYIEDGAVQVVYFRPDSSISAQPPIRNMPHYRAVIGMDFDHYINRYKSRPERRIEPAHIASAISIQIPQQARVLHDVHHGRDRVGRPARVARHQTSTAASAERG